MRRFYCPTQACAIELLYRAAAAYRERRPEIAKGFYSGGKQVVATHHSPDLVVDLAGAIQGHDYVGCHADYLSCKARQKETRRQDSDANSSFLEDGAKFGKLGIHQRLPAREYHVFDTQRPDVGKQIEQRLRRQFTLI